MRLGEMTQKQLLKIAFSKHKTVAIGGSVEIPRPILTVDDSSILLFEKPY